MYIYIYIHMGSSYIQSMYQYVYIYIYPISTELSKCKSHGHMTQVLSWLANHMLSEMASPSRTVFVYGFSAENRGIIDQINESTHIYSTPGVS